MNAEIIAIGDELTSGQRLDTNSQWLAQQLGDLGLKVAFHTTIGDRFEDNLVAFRIAASRNDVVIATGGLGPTADDLTREAIAAAFNAPLEYRDEAMKHIESLFAQRKRPMPERNRVQAMFPSGSRLIANKFGTAPGIDYCVQGERACRIFALPGVPAEMHEMYNEVVRPRLVNEMGFGKQRWFYKNIRLFGLGESDVEALIPDLIARQREPIVGITVSKATINLRIAALAGDEGEALEKMQSTVEEIEAKLSEFIFGADEEEPWDAVANLLHQRNQQMRLIEYGAASVLAPQLIAAAQKVSTNLRIVGTSWSFTKPSQPILSDAKDWTMVIGPYPAISEADAPNGKIPGGQIQVELWFGNQIVKTHTQGVSGHPDIIFPRMAKTACKVWLDFCKSM